MLRNETFILDENGKGQLFKPNPFLTAKLIGEIGRQTNESLLNGVESMCV